MALLAGTMYDPATAVNPLLSQASLTAMTALDTTNLRLSFTAPSSGQVFVRLCVTGTNSSTTTCPQMLLGVMSGATVVGRVACGNTRGVNNATGYDKFEAQFVVPGLTPSSNYTWDAAAAVQVVAASSALKVGGPNDTTGNNAWGGISFEIWDANDCLGANLYDPSTAGNLTGTASGVAMTKIDTGNTFGRITFTAPTSGNVLVRIHGTVHGTTTNTQYTLGVLESTTVLGRQLATTYGNRYLATTQQVAEAEFVVTGISGGSHTYDAAYGIDGAANASGYMKWGGPNNTTGNNAFGAFTYEVWKA